MKTLVIGATGIIGNHIVRTLLKRGHDVVACSRGITPKKNLDGLKIKYVTADLGNKESLQKACDGVDWIFHAAAYYPQNAFHKKQHEQQALFELQNFLDVIKTSRVQRVVYTSSLTTIGKAKTEGLADESCAYHLFGQDPHPYFRVKYLCEEVVKAVARKEGLPIVIVNPAGCFGPFELKPKRLCLIPQLVSLDMPAYVNQNINVVDVADVAEGHVLAAEKGAVGERYILGGHNTTTRELIFEICEQAGVRPPAFRVPLSLGLCVCQLSEVKALLTRTIPQQSILGLRFIQYGQHLSSEKAVRELGYTINPMQPCFERAIAWYRKTGYC